MLAKRYGRHAEERVAVVAGDGLLTYGELDRRVRTAAAMFAGNGVGPGGLVAVHTGRSTWAVVAMLAAWRCGAAYTVVADGGDVADRIRDLDADLVVTVDGRLGTLTGCGATALSLDGPATELSEPPAHPVGADDPAYVLYTSGTTGAPKGAVVTHGNIAHYVSALLRRLGVAGPVSFAHVSALTADLGNTSLFLPLWTGGTVHLVDEDTRHDPVALWTYLRHTGVDGLKITPSHWAALLPAMPGDHRPLRFLLLGGEALDPALAVRTLDSGAARTLVNHYGPTETTVGVLANVISSTDDIDRHAPSVPVGRPLGDTTIVVLDASGRYAARDATGELHVGGPSVGLGYRGDAATTRTKFVTDLPGDGRFYRTGATGSASTSMAWSTSSDGSTDR